MVSCLRSCEIGKLGVTSSIIEAKRLASLCYASPYALDPCSNFPILNYSVYKVAQLMGGFYYVHPKISLPILP